MQYCIVPDGHHETKSKRIRSSEPNCRLIPPRSSLLHTCSRRSRCPTSASHSSRPTVGLGACGLELPATCPGEVILQIREKNRGKDNPSGRRCSLLPTMSSSERESRKLLRCKEGSYWPGTSVRRNAAILLVLGVNRKRWHTHEMTRMTPRRLQAANQCIARATTHLLTRSPRRRGRARSVEW
jgi:hypothetical protein